MCQGGIVMQTHLNLCTASFEYVGYQVRVLYAYILFFFK